MNLAPGTHVGPYEVLGILGAGGMGQVYKARDTRLARDVALKFLTDRAGPDHAPAVLREARAAARLNHPHIAAIYDVLEGGDAPVLVMEFVDGESLSAVADRGPIEADRALAIGIQLASALEYSHREGIIHRDVKPGNIAVTRSGDVKLLDLGIARDVTPDALATTHTPAASTGIKGTPAYMAPEQLMGRPATARTDVYGAGVSLYELLTGTRPYPGRDALSMAMALGAGPVPRVSSTRPEVPVGLDQVVAKAMAIDPADRFGSAGELKTALEEVRDTGRAPISVRVDPRARRSRLIAAAGVITIAAGLGIWQIVRHPRPLGAAPLIVLPARNVSNDPAIDTLGAGLVSVVTDNLAVASGLTVVSASPSAARDRRWDLRQLAVDLGAGYAVALSVKPAGAGIHVDGELVKVGVSTPVWQASEDGTPLAVERRLIEGLADAVEWYGVLPRALTREESRLLRRLPTDSPGAFDEYSTARATMDATAERASTEKAVAAYLRALQADPAFGLALAGLSRAYGVMYDQTKDLAWIERAADAATRALAIDPNRSLVHVSMSKVYRAAARYEEAERHARRAVGLSPQSDDAHRELANVLNERGNLGGAVAEMRTAIDLRPNYAATHALLGYMLITHAKYADAIDPLTRATELDSRDANTFQLLGTAYHDLGDLPRAIGNYEHALRLRPNANAFSNLATFYYASGQFERAADNYQRALEVDVSSPTTHANLADTLVRLGRTTEAAKEYADAAARAEANIKRKPGDGRMIAILAVCQAKLGRFDEATRRIDEALAMAPTDVEVAYKSAVVPALAAHPARALGQLQHALDLGYPPSFVLEDWDLRALRPDPAFALLVNRYKSKQK